MRRASILFLACIPLVFGMFSSAAMAFEKKVVLAEAFVATW